MSMFHECTDECDETDGHFHLVGHCFNCGMRVQAYPNGSAVDDGGNMDCPSPYIRAHVAVISS